MYDLLVDTCNQMVEWLLTSNNCWHQEKDAHLLSFKNFFKSNHRRWPATLLNSIIVVFLWNLKKALRTTILKSTSEWLVILF